MQHATGIPRFCKFTSEASTETLNYDDVSIRCYSQKVTRVLSCKMSVENKKLHRKALTIQEKVDIIKAVEGGSRQSEICRKKSLKKTTVSTVLKN